MLVCVFVCAFCTRDRGCSAHPAFPAPSDFNGANEFCKTRTKHAAGMRRRVWNSGPLVALTHVVPDKRAPRARSGTHNHECVWCAMLERQSCLQQSLVVMGPCV